MWRAVVLFAAVCLTSTSAIAPCDDKFVAGLSSNPECYKDGKPPVMLNTKEVAGAVGTTLRITKDDLPPDTKCLTGRQDQDNTYVNIFFNSGSEKTVPMKHEVKDGWIQETDEKGVKYKMFIVHNEAFSFSYYKCIDGASGGTGSPLVSISVDCKLAKSEETKKAIEKAETCFTKLGVKNLVALPPCDC